MIAVARLCCHESCTALFAATPLIMPCKATDAASERVRSSPSTITARCTVSTRVWRA